MMIHLIITICLPNPHPLPRDAFWNRWEKTPHSDKGNGNFLWHRFFLHVNTLRWATIDPNLASIPNQAT